MTYDRYDLMDDVSWSVGFLLLPVSLLWRCLKTIHQFACDC